jgi:hypothetical protein
MIRRNSRFEEAPVDRKIRASALTILGMGTLAHHPPQK